MFIVKTGSKMMCVCETDQRANEVSEKLERFNKFTINFFKKLEEDELKTFCDDLDKKLNDLYTEYPQMGMELKGFISSPIIFDQHKERFEELKKNFMDEYFAAAVKIAKYNEFADEIKRLIDQKIETYLENFHPDEDLQEVSEMWFEEFGQDKRYIYDGNEDREFYSEEVNSF